jgi:hypothetical protein
MCSFCYSTVLGNGLVLFFFSNYYIEEAHSELEFIADVLSVVSLYARRKSLIPLPGRWTGPVTIHPTK